MRESALRRYRAAGRSPTWFSSDAEFAATAESFDNPVVVDVVVHSYRHRYGLVDGDPAYQPTEAALARKPPVTVPTVVLEGGRDTVEAPKARSEHDRYLRALVDHGVVDAGHSVPQEAPAELAVRSPTCGAAL